MTPLPGPRGAGAGLVAWRLDAEAYAPAWDSGLGAERYGGRWNPKGVRAVYCSVDPATAILESAVHRGFKVLDSQPFLLTCLRIVDPSAVRLVAPDDLPDRAWLAPGIPGTAQQDFGARLLDAHPFVALPSVVSRFSWNLLFRPDTAAGRYSFVGQERLVLDARLPSGARGRTPRGLG